MHIVYFNTIARYQQSNTNNLLNSSYQKSITLYSSFHYITLPEVCFKHFSIQVFSIIITSLCIVLEHNLGCAISQHVDAQQLSSPTKQSQQ